MSALLRVLALTCCMPALAGCATTQPWQREVLAKPVMSPDCNARRDTLRNHYLATREGAVGGFGGGGGGCGCN